MHYWLISAPAENGSKEEAFKNLQRATSEMSSNYKMKIPELRVGTLDSLMTLSDELERIDRSGP
jgi:V-type H+-transporting ATPase subunit C